MIILFLIAAICAVPLLSIVLFWCGVVAGCEGLDKWSTAKEERRNRRAEQGLDPDGASYNPLTSKQWDAEFPRK